MTFSVRPFQSDSVAPPSAATALPVGWLDGSICLDLEIGCGVGWHPIRYARENTSRRLIAIEHTREKFERFAGRLEKNAELANLHPVHADAVRWVTHTLPPRSLERVILLYPNPEPKAANKRWLRMPFLYRLLESLRPGGELWLATNDRAYFEEAHLYAENVWALELKERREFTAANAPSGVPRTHFEKKYLLRGETCFDVRWRKP